MTKRKMVFAGLLLLAIILGTVKVISLTGWGNAVLFPVSQAGRELMAPFYKGLSAVTSGPRGLIGYFSDNSALRQQNEQLRQELAQLEERVYLLQEQELENQRLRELLNYKDAKSDNYSLALARVIGRDPSNWYKTVIIDQGKNQGVQVNMPVITHQGLVGTVIGVSANTAEVLLILDGEGAVGARIFETRVTPGVIIGNGYSEILEMMHLPHNAELEEGQTVVTSGLGGLYPKGIRIGTVQEVNLEPNGLTKTAIVAPFVDFSRLEEVFVILQVKTPEEDQASTQVTPADSSIPQKPSSPGGEIR